MESAQGAQGAGAGGQRRGIVSKDNKEELNKALWRAALSQDESKALWALAAGADPNSLSSEEPTWTILALVVARWIPDGAKGAEAVAKALLEAGADPGKRSMGDYYSPWQCLAFGGAPVWLVTEMIKRAPLIGSKDCKGKTALHYAARRGNPEMALALMEAGEDPLARDNEGATPYDLAVQEERSLTAGAIASRVEAMELEASAHRGASNRPTRM